MQVEVTKFPNIRRRISMTSSQMLTTRTWMMTTRILLTKSVERCTRCNMMESSSISRTWPLLSKPPLRRKLKTPAGTWWSAPISAHLWVTSTKVSTCFGWNTSASCYGDTAEPLTHEHTISETVWNSISQILVVLQPSSLSKCQSLVFYPKRICKYSVLLFSHLITATQVRLFRFDGYR